VIVNLVFVVRGLDPRIHRFAIKRMDCPVKPGNGGT